MKKRNLRARKEKPMTALSIRGNASTWTSHSISNVGYPFGRLILTNSAITINVRAFMKQEIIELRWLHSRFPKLIIVCKYNGEIFLVGFSVFRKTTGMKLRSALLECGYIFTSEHEKYSTEMWQNDIKTYGLISDIH